MSFQLTEEQRLAVDSLRKFLDTELEPEYLAHGEGYVPREKMQDWIKRLIPFGLLVAPHPEKYGGLELGWSTHVRLWEEVVYSSIVLAGPLLLNTLVVELLVKYGAQHLVDRYVPGILSGDVIASMGVSEPDVGSDVAAAKCRAVRDGDDWVINGEKTWITNGSYSDFFICTCKTGDGELTHILIDRKEHGYEVRDIHKMAMNGQSTAQVFLNNVRVPVSNTVGKIGDGLRNTLIIFERARCHMACWGYGIARRAKDEAIKYSQQRIQHGKPIAGHQLIADKIATMATEIDAARLLTWRALDMIDNGQRCDTESSMAKWYGTEVGVRAARDALQIHGGNGVTTEFIVERLFREAVIAPIPDGTTEIQKLIISRNLTGIQAFR
ncbi:MAG: acyl-CoA dehydrogenase family protein [Pseudoxanthomonas sp.]